MGANDMYTSPFVPERFLAAGSKSFYSSGLMKIFESVARIILANQIL